jgi:hypothetical protein
MPKLFGKNASTFLAALAAAVFASQQALADQVHYSFQIAAGGSSPAINIPITNTPVIVSCTQTVAGNVGTGQATLVRSTTDGYLVWAAYDNSGTSHAFSSGHIVYCDFSTKVDIETSGTTAIVIKNPQSVAQTVDVMLTY